MPNEMNTFWQALENALKNYDDPIWLGERSPLASPYFLGTWLSTLNINHPNHREWGRALQSLLKTATEAITGKYEDRYRTILIEYYFQNRKVDYMLDKMGLGKDAFHKSRKRAISALKQTLIELLRPSLRLENRPDIEEFFGYNTEIAACQATLKDGDSAAIIGNVGCGKTVFGSDVSQAWQIHEIFWYTIQPHLNDQRNTLLFALGYFFHTCGSSALWFQLVADGDKINHELIPSLLQFTVEELGERSILLCFDQVELLRPTESHEHAAIVALLNRLKEYVPVLLMGQQVPIETDAVYSLQKLSLAITKEWFDSRGLSASLVELEQIHSYTNGNPRLLELFLSLALEESAREEADDGQLADLLAELSNNLSVDFMLKRIMAQLTEVELSILAALAVFRRPAPADAWHTSQESFALHRLQQRHLVQSDPQGGIALLPIYRTLIYSDLPPDMRELLHSQAAQIRAERGEYTAAAYHLIQADQGEEAIRLWHEHRQQEIEQGQAKSALMLWRNLATSRLSAETQDYLNLIQSELHTLLGEYDEAKKTLNANTWHSMAMKIYKTEQNAHIARAENRSSDALSGYNETIKITEDILNSTLAHAHKNLATIYIREQELDRAWHEAQLAHYEVEHLQGRLQRKQNDWQMATQHYLAAYALAEALNHSEGLAKTATSLASIYWMQGQLDLAKSYMEQAVQHYERMGKVVAIAGVRVNATAFYNRAGAYSQALEVGQEANRIFAQLLDGRGQAMANQNLSEAYLGLNKLDEAEDCVRFVVESEEIDLLPDGYRVFGEIAALRGDFPTAEKFINDSIELAQSNQDLWLEAYAHRALGKTCQMQQKSDDADVSFDKAIALFGELGSENEIEATRILTE